jgi:hypothetical protein
MFKHNDRVVWTAPTNNAIYPRQSTPPFGTLGTFIHEPHLPDSNSYVQFDSGHTIQSFDCKMINVRHACDQDDRQLIHPYDRTERSARLIQSLSDLAALELKQRALRVLKTQQAEDYAEFERVEDYAEFERFLNEVGTVEEIESLQTIHARNLQSGSGY